MSDKEKEEKPKIYSYEGSTPLKVLDHMSAVHWVRYKTWARVDSSNVGRIRYDQDTMELFVEFQNGSTYLYRAVPDQVAADFFNSDSMGKFMSRRIKGLYSYQKL